MTADCNRCHNCSWTEWRDDAEFKNRRKCPECGAEFSHIYQERIFQ